MKTFYKILFVAAALAALTLPERVAHAQSVYSFVDDEGTPLARRRVLNFVGGGVTCTDDSANHRTLCTINSAGGSFAQGATVLTAGFQLKDASPALGGNLFSVASNDGSVVYFASTASGMIGAAIGPAANQLHTLPAVAPDTFALLAASQTFTNKTLTSPAIGTPTLSGEATMTDGAASIGDASHRLSAAWSRAYGTAAIVDAYSATPAFDASLGELHQITLTGDVTGWSLINGVMGQVVSIQLFQDGAGNHAVSGANAAIKLAGGAYTLTVTASKSDVLTFRFDGTNWYEIARSQNL